MYEVDQYTVSLLHFDDGIKDETGKVWNGVGTPVISNTQSKIGGKSLYLEGGSYLSTPASDNLKFGIEDFTVDWWEYRTGAVTKAQVAVSCATSSTANISFIFGATNSNGFGDNIVWYMSSNGTTWDISGARTMGTAIYNEWVHYAITRKDGTFYVFQNGILKDSLYSSAPIFNSVADFLIGSFASPTELFQGYIDEFRISKGIARWTEDFDPEPIKTTAILRVTMIDSSEREYRLSIKEIEDFITWFKRTLGTGSSCYELSDIVDNSKEYLAFEKIISFKVISLNN